jgi:hypothetical protein
MAQRIFVSLKNKFEQENIKKKEHIYCLIYLKNDRILPVHSQQNMSFTIKNTTTD